MTAKWKQPPLMQIKRPQKCEINLDMVNLGAGPVTLEEQAALKYSAAYWSCKGSMTTLSTSTTARVYERVGELSAQKMMDTLSTLKLESVFPVTTESPQVRWCDTASYSAVGTTNDRFKAICKRLAEDLPYVMRRTGASHIVVRGTSGLSVCFGMRMICDIPFIVARKAGENAHGSAIVAVGPSSAKAQRYLILDDFIDSGSTVRGIVNDMQPAQCVGIVSYRGSCDPFNRIGNSGPEGKCLNLDLWRYE